MNTKRSVWAKLGRGLSVLPALPLLSLWAGGLMGRGESIGDVGRVGFYPIIEGPLIVANRPGKLPENPELSQTVGSRFGCARSIPGKRVEVPRPPSDLFRRVPSDPQPEDPQGGPDGRA